MVMRVGFVTLLVVALGSNVARADDGQSPQAKLDAAQAHHAEGNRHFNLAEYDAAIAEYKQAYHLSEKPGLLFNIAQAYRLKGDCALALRFYENYRRLAPDAENRAVVEQHVAAMRKCVPEHGGTAPTHAAAPAATNNTTATTIRTSDEQPSHSRFPSWSRWAALGVTVLAAGAGTYFGIRTLDTGVSDDAAASAATRANVSFAVSGAFAIGSVALFVW